MTSSMPTQKSLKRAASVAIAFAAGTLNLPLPVLSETKSEATNSVIQEIVESKETPELRAYYLLRLANCYLDGKTGTEAEAQFRPILNAAYVEPTFTKHRNDAMLGSWAEQLCSEKQENEKAKSSNSILKTEPSATTIENSAFASAAIQKALRELSWASAPNAKSYMYFIASRLYQKSGNRDGRQECNALLEETFKACETDSQIDQGQIMASISVLNSMANCIIPVHFAYQNENDGLAARQAPNTSLKQYTKEEFKECEKLRLRALTMADRLDKKSHVRRKAHRDQVLWYRQLGKAELADNELHKLFSLVGFEDDSILYPQPGSCGNVAWWTKPGQVFLYLCGMG